MKFLFVIFLLPLQLFAQDITGVWTGTLYNDTTKQFINYELAISVDNGEFSGYSHTIFVIDSVENIGVKSIRVKKAGEEFIVEDYKLVYNNYTGPPAKRVKQYSDLFLSQNDTSLVLSGPWKTNRTKEYKGLTGKVFLQKKRNIKETLIIAKLENLGLTGSLSFMAPPAQSNDLALLNNRGFNSAEPKKIVDLVKEPVSNTKVPANTETQQAGKERNEGKPFTEAVLNKKNAAKEKTKITGVQLPVPDMTIQKEKSLDVISTSRVSTKSETLRINKQQKAGKEISGAVLNKDDTVVNKEIIKEIPPPVAEMFATKKERTTIGSTNTGTPEVNKQQKAAKEVSEGTLNKDEEFLNNGIIKEILPPLAETSAPKKERSAISATSETHRVTKQRNMGKESSGAASNKDDIAMSKNIVEKIPSLVAEVSAAKIPTDIVSMRSETHKVSERQQAEKEVSGMVFKDNSGGINPVKQAVSQPAAEIANRKIEPIRNVEIKNDSLLLTLYDNGEIDGDTVSVLLNGKVIMPKQGLMSKAINKTIYLTPEMGDSLVLIMYAENLGSIPPNTGLLVIHDGDDIYEIRFTGDLEKNSSIILKRKREK